MKTMTQFLTLAIVLMVSEADVSALLRHGDQAVVVSGTPAGRVRARTIPSVKDGNVSRGAFIEWVPEKTLMKFLEKRNFGSETWVRVELKSGTEAWISGLYLDQTIARDQLIVRSVNGNIRNQASINSAKIDVVKRGDILGRIRKRDTWYLAELPNKKRGWIHEDLVRLEALAPAEPKAEAPAKVEEEPEKPKVDYRAVAQRAIDAGKPKDAIEAYKKALEEEPNNGILHFELAKLYDKQGQVEEAIPHLRKAISGRPARPEAEFTLKRLVKAREAAAAPVPSVEEGDEEVVEPLDGEEDVSPIFEVFAENAVYILPAAAIGSLAFIAILVVLYRRRRIGTSAPSFRRRKADGGFDDVLKYAVEKRPVIREIEEAEKKLSEMDEALNKRFASFQEKDKSGKPRLPPGESAERLIKRVDTLRKTILNQEERARIYSDLVVLQNEKITALDDEIDALKKLVQLDYKEAKTGAKPSPPKPKKAAQAPTQPSKPDSDKS